MSKETGGPAFPQQPVITRPGYGETVTTLTGMTLRDYFAAKAVGSVLLAAIDQNVAATEPVTEAVLAAQAYAIADAMLAERAK